MSLSMSECRVEDLDLVVMRARDGSHEAFAELVRRYQHDVRAVICRHLGRGPAADDIAQEVFVHAFRNIATFRAQGSIRSWLLGITRNLIVSHFRPLAFGFAAGGTFVSAPCRPQAAGDEMINRPLLLEQPKIYASVGHGLDHGKSNALKRAPCQSENAAGPYLQVDRAQSM